jgi:hypothetical protein
MQVEVESGRLIEYRRRQTDHYQVTTVTTEQGAFARRRSELDRGTSSLENAFDARRPATSLARFFLEDELLLQVLDQISGGHDADRQETLDNWREFVPIARKIVAKGALAPIDRWLSPKEKQQTARFHIPQYGAPPGGGPAAIAGGLAFDAANHLFPRDTWAWTVMREAALNVSGRGKYTQHELQRLYESPESGPLCQLAIAALLNAARSPHAGRFAGRGLERLTVVDFQNDYRPLLDGDYVAGACLLKAAEVARELTDEEAEAVGRALLGDEARYFVEAARILRERRDEPIEAALPDALDALWERGLLPLVSSALQDIQRR